MDELRILAADLREAPARAQRNAMAIVERGALNVKEGWASNARISAGAHGKRYPDSISYDMVLGGALVGNIAAEIGPESSKPQGGMGRGFEFGSVNQPPHNDGGRALRDEAPKFEAALTAVALDALGF